jgi:hypothetical protein
MYYVRIVLHKSSSTECMSSTTTTKLSLTPKTYKTFVRPFLWQMEALETLMPPQGGSMPMLPQNLLIFGMKC